VTQQTPPAPSRLQRTLAFIIAGLFILSVLAIVAIIAGTAMGAFAAQGSGSGIWPTVFFIPLIGLPIAFVLLIVVLIDNFRQRSRANRNSQR